MIPELNLPTISAAIIKIGGIGASFFYVLFSLIILKQIQTMKKVVQINDKNLIFTLGTVQLFMAGVLLAYSLLLL